jgi:hypothetical protein
MVWSASVLGLHGLEGACAHMQRDAGAPHAARSQFRQQGLIEMQRCRGGGHRAGVAGEDGLVALRVVGGVGVGDVGRQRHMAVLFHQRVGLATELEAEQRAARIGPAPQQPGAEAAARAARHVERGAGQRLLADLHVGDHFVAVPGADTGVGQHPLHQQFHLAPRGLLAKEPRLDDLRVVEHQQVARVQQPGQFMEDAVHRRGGGAVEQP